MQKEQTVFIVDDDDAVLDSLGVLLASHGLNIASFHSGQEFLDVYDPSARGCLLLDIRMPDISGLELQEKLVEKNASLPIIVMTGHGDIKIAVRAMKLGAFDFIEKPFRDDLIINSIHEALAYDQQNQDQSEQIEKIHQLYVLLTEREKEVFHYLVQGHLSKTIAATLEISPRTAELHRAHIMEKFQVRNLSQLVKMAMIASLE